MGNRQYTKQHKHMYMIYSLSLYIYTYIKRERARDMYIYICIYLYKYTYIHIYTHIYIYDHILISLSLSLFIYIHIHIIIPDSHDMCLDFYGYVLQFLQAHNLFLTTTLPMGQTWVAYSTKHTLADSYSPQEGTIARAI